MSKSLDQCIREHLSFSQGDLSTIQDKFQTRSLMRGAYLLESGRLCREMAYIESGYLRMFDLVDGKEITLWIGGQGNFITSLSSFVFGSNNFWNIQAVTDCSLQIITRTDHEFLLQNLTKWLEFDNLLLSRAFAQLEQKMFSHLHTTSRERYENLMLENPDIFNQVPLQYIASMLGVSPETLSRLRKNRLPRSS